MEDEGITTSIYTISASDADSDTLTYELVLGAPEFALDSSTRIVSIGSALNFDVPPTVYSVTFK